MSQYPALTPEQAFQELQLWFSESSTLKDLKQAEFFKRERLSNFYFPNAAKGTNRLDLGGGFDLKLVASQNVKCDEAAIDNVTAGQIKALRLPWDELFIYKPTMSQTVYNNLTIEQKAFVDQLIEITPGAPQLEIVKRAEELAAVLPESGVHFTGHNQLTGYAQAGEGKTTTVATTEKKKRGPKKITPTETKPELVIVIDPQTAKPGQFYFVPETDTTIDTLWYFNDRSEWEGVENPETIALAKSLFEKATPKRRGRKAKAV